MLVLALLPPAIIAALLAVHFTDSRLRDVEAQLRERGGQSSASWLRPANMGCTCVIRTSCRRSLIP